MKDSDATYFIAMFMYANGPRVLGKNEGCLNPESNDKEFRNVSKFLFRKYKATHYTREWIDKNNIRVNLYSGDAFGACLDLNFIKSFIVNMEEV